MTPLKWFRAFYLTVFALTVAVEVWAVTRHGSGFTMSEWVWSKVRTVPLRAALGALLVWLVWHFLWAGPRRGLGRMDLAFVMVGAIVGIAATRWGWR